MIDSAAPPETIELADAQEGLEQAMARANAEHRRIVVEREGQAIGAIVSLEDLRRLQEMDRRRKRAMAHLEAIGEAFADVDPEEVDREIAKALEEVRAEMREERRAAAGS